MLPVITPPSPWKKTTSGLKPKNETTKVPQVSTVTTTQRDALTAVNGMIIYNSTTTQFEIYENGSWVGLILSSGTKAYTGTGDGFKDEDDMASDSATATASQQSIKAYVDNMTYFFSQMSFNSAFNEFDNWILSNTTINSNNRIELSAL